MRHALDACIGRNPIAIWFGDGCDVAAAAAFQHIPLRVAVNGQKSVVVKEAQQRECREAANLVKRSGPHGRGHRIEIQLRHLVAEVVLRKIFAQRQLDRSRRLWPRNEFGGDAVEAGNFREQFVMDWPQKVAALREEAAQAPAAVFHAATAARRKAADTEAHVTGLPLHAELLHQADEVRVGAVIVDDETCVYVLRALAGFNRMGVGVATDAAVALEQPDDVAAAQQPGSCQPGDSRTDDCDAFATLLGCRQT